MSLQERLTQCRADKAAIEANERELLDQIKESEAAERVPKFGDVVDCLHGERVVLYDAGGRLCVFKCSSTGFPVQDLTPLSFYAFTGGNIFKDNLLNLD